MCMLCIEMQKGTMTKKEVDRAIMEIKSDDPHYFEIRKLMSTLFPDEKTSGGLHIIKDHFPVFDENDEYNGWGEYGDD